jgi:hypothetical protein
VHAVGPLTAEVAGDEVEELLEVAVERGVPALLDAELDPHGHRLGSQDHVDGPFHVGQVDLGVGHPLGHRHPGEDLGHLGKAVGVLGQTGSCVPSGRRRSGVCFQAPGVIRRPPSVSSSNKLTLSPSVP